MIINSNWEESGTLRLGLLASLLEWLLLLDGRLVVLSRVTASVLLLTNTITRHVDKEPEQRELNKDLPGQREEQQSTRNYLKRYI